MKMDQVGAPAPGISLASDSAAERQALVEAAREWGYFSGGILTQKELWHGRRILDVGMGAGPHAVGFIEGGAAGYIGVDPTLAGKILNLRSRTDPSTPNDHAFPFSVQDIERIYPNVHLYPGLLEDVSTKVKGHRVNVALMSAVTEHLRHPERVFQAIWEVLERDGVLWASHCNYYSWTGHHYPPRSVSQWNRDNLFENENVDWKHLEPTHQASTNPAFNRIRLEDLRLVIAKYFEIQGWKVSVEAVSRLTPEIRKKWRKYSLSELLGKNIYIIGRRRDVPLDIDLSGRQLFHPREDYLADRDYLSEDIVPFELNNGVYFSDRGELCSHSNNDFAAIKVFARLNPGDTIIISKFRSRYTFTVAEVMYPKGAATRLRLAEPVPEALRTVDHADWTIEL